jgi:glutamate dehydrogenase/leucine dehydrogenase
MLIVQFSKTRFTTCISPRLGGSGNPSVPTALGVKVAMDSALNIVSQTTLEGKTVAIQVDLISSSSFLIVNGIT